MTTFPKVTLKSGRDRSVRRFHLWIFSGAIKKIEGGPEDGDTVEVFSNSGEYLATGHFQNGSIMIRIFSFEQTDAGEAFWHSKLNTAINYRKQLGFFDNPGTNIFRLIHGEGDRLPGLIADYYNGVVVLQAHSVGMYRMRSLFSKIITDILNLRVIAIYDKSSSTLNIAGKEAGNNFLYGKADNAIVKEYGNQFEIDFIGGQKTGFFIDQRENRRLLQNYCSGKKVANIFSYTGGFSVYAARGNATLIDSVDASENAIEIARINMNENSGKNTSHRFYCDDAFDFLNNATEKYDVIILDPPAFAKHQNATKNALKAYRRINEMAIRMMASPGILFTFSCSQVISRDDFRIAVFAAAATTGRQVRILHQLTQPPDHPINIYHPEGEYLKGLVLYVE
nr:class I SAM-dependent rRNA methyltransferase [Bacteroidota bacterium]